MVCIIIIKHQYLGQCLGTFLNFICLKTEVQEPYINTHLDDPLFKKSHRTPYHILRFKDSAIVSRSYVYTQIFSLTFDIAMQIIKADRCLHCSQRQTQ